MFLTPINIPTTTFLASPITGLTELQACSILAALDDSWSADQIEACDDGLSILLTPSGSADSKINYLIESVEGRFRLSVVQHDEMEFRGSYGTVDSLVCSLRKLCLGS